MPQGGRVMFNQFKELEEKRYEHYDKGYGLRKHPRVLLTLPVELTYNENQQPLLLECESRDISAEGMFLKFVAPKEELDNLVGKPVEVGLQRQRPIAEKCSIKGKFAWTSKPVKNPSDGKYYIFCGVQFEKELPLSLQLEQLAISAHKTLENLVVYYRKDSEKESLDPLKQISNIWAQAKSNIPEFAYTACVYWYYYVPRDVFIKNSMHINQEDSVLYRLDDDNKIREHLMEHRIPISDTEMAQRVFYPAFNNRRPANEEKPLSEWLFPLFDEDEFLGLTQFVFLKEINPLLGLDKIYWLCVQISNYASNVIKSEELKRDDDYTKILPQLIKLCEPHCEKSELYAFYKRILEKFTDLTGEAPSFLNLYSKRLPEGNHDDSVPSLSIYAVKNLKDAHRKDITGSRMIKNDCVNCCPLSLLEKHHPHFCEFNCSPDKNSRMFCVPILSQNELIALACFAVSKSFRPTERLVRRINEVSRTSSLFIQLCLRLVPNMHINYVLGCENNVF
jgi:hypothetical protein